jgi:hypothetical protein
MELSQWFHNQAGTAEVVVVTVGAVITVGAVGSLISGAVITVGAVGSFPYGSLIVGRVVSPVLVVEVVFEVLTSNPLDLTKGFCTRAILVVVLVVFIVELVMFIVALVVLVILTDLVALICSFPAIATLNENAKNVAININIPAFIEFFIHSLLIFSN